jgi:hypothetical protein
MSWMLGIAASRRVLEDEGYRWVAPLSAFFKNAVAAVNLSAWNPAFRAQIRRRRREVEGANSSFRMGPNVGSIVGPIGKAKSAKKMT